MGYFKRDATAPKAARRKCFNPGCVNGDVQRPDGIWKFCPACNGTGFVGYAGADAEAVAEPKLRAEAERKRK